MTDTFTPDFFTNNRQTLHKRIGQGTPIVVTGNGLMQRGADESFKFHQDSNFWYLTGISAPDLTLVITARDTYLIVPTLSAHREAFDGTHDVASYAARSGITTVLDARAGWLRLRAEMQASSNVAVLASPPGVLKAYGLHTLPYRRLLIAKLKRMNPALELQDIRVDLAALRCVKQPVELQAMQQAIDITCQTLQEIAGQLDAANHEYELEAAISYSFRTKGASGHAFMPIVGAGKHTTTLHYNDNNSSIATDDLIVLDIGAEVGHYAADVTRTVSMEPITGRKAEVFNAVAAVQDYALSLLKPGVLSREYEKKVEAFMGEQLRKLGLITTDTSEDIRRYFPHGTSHFIGLDTHDVGSYQEPWQANMVITCEPGIYIPEESIGVRIEDDVLITKTGHEVLSRACPRVLTPVQ